jgi:hypothetical protein
MYVLKKRFNSKIRAAVLMLKNVIWRIFSSFLTWFRNYKTDTKQRYNDRCINNVCIFNYNPVLNEIIIRAYTRYKTILFKFTTTGSFLSASSISYRRYMLQCYVILLMIFCIETFYFPVRCHRSCWIENIDSFDGCLLGFSAVKSGGSLPTFQRSLLPSSSGRCVARLHGATNQKTAIFVLTAVRTSNPT